MNEAQIFEVMNGGTVCGIRRDLNGTSILLRIRTRDSQPLQVEIPCMDEVTANTYI